MNPQHDLKALNTNAYVGQTDRTPRPVGPADGKFGVTGRADLLRDQKLWDAAKAWQAENDELRAKRLAAIDAERTARADAWRREAADAVVEELRTKYLRADPSATDADFDKDLPEIQRQRRIAAALAETARVGPSAGRRI